MENKLSGRNNKKKRNFAWAGGLLIVIAGLCFARLYFANTFPISDGWQVNYAEMMLRGKVPYRDFYYYLPPLDLFVSILFWKLSFGFLFVFRCWYLVERLVIYLMIYRLLCRYFQWQHAALACVIGEIICGADVYDLFGDYNQHVLFLAVLMVWHALNFLEREDLTGRKKMLFWAGVDLGLMFLCKQTIFLSSFIIYLGVLTLSCRIKKDRNFPQYVGTVALGSLIPVGVAGIYLAVNGALVQALDQVFFSVNGKGTILDIIVFNPLRRFFHPESGTIALMLFLMMLIMRELNQGKSRKLMVYASILGVALALSVAVQFDFIQYGKVFLDSRRAILLVVGAFLPFTVILLGKKWIPRWPLWLDLGVAFGAGCCVAGAVVLPELQIGLFETGLFGSIAVLVNVTALYYQICFLVYCFWKMKDEPCGGAHEKLAMFSAAGISMCYAGMMAAAEDGLAYNSMRILLPFTLCCWLAAFSGNWVGKILQYGIGGLFALLITLCCVQKINCSYAWWGTLSEPMWEKTYSTDLPQLKGFTFTAEDKEMYETVTRLILENTDPDDVIFGYPFIKIFNILTQRYESTFVPVLWYDVVGDKYVEQTILELQKDLPEIVIWKEIPSGLLEHENKYRNGEPLVQRRLEEWFRGILSSEYQLLADLNGVQVYKLTDE